MAEHRFCTPGVAGSIPAISSIFFIHKMHNATEISSEEIVRLLAGSELGFLPLLSDGPSELDSIAKVKTCDDDIVFLRRRISDHMPAFPGLLSSRSAKYLK